jgi:Ribosome inactivating protein
MALTGVMIGGAGAAQADVPSYSITHVYINLGNAGPSAQSQYSQLIGSLRAAAGQAYRDGVIATQYYNVNSLIRLSLAYQNVHLDLLISPNDMYVRAFTNNVGQTFQFNDPDYNLEGVLQEIPNNGVSGISTLAFGSNYNSMAQAAGRQRDAMPISFNDLTGSVRNLANTTDPYGTNQQAVARSLMFMIQYTSEAARFNDVYGVMSAIMVNYNTVYHGLPTLQQYLENSWAAISGFGQRISANPSSAPLNVNGVGTLYSWSDVARYLALLLLNLALPQEGQSGDWNHTEL